MPLVEVLEHLPDLPAALHVSGALLEHAEARYPTDLARIRALVQAERLEILGGGWFDPVLSVLPERDASGQVRMMGRRAESLLGQRPRGAWLPYGAWDPALPRVLGRQEIRYAVLDPTPFRCAGHTPGDIQGWYTTEREGVPLALFPTDDDLSRVDCLTDPARVLSLLRRKAAQDAGLLTWILDMRNFGVRPGTWDCTWGRQGGWMPRLLRQLATQDHWIKALSFTQALARLDPRGRVYLPSAWSGEGSTEASEPVRPDLTPIPLAASPAATMPTCMPWETWLARYEEANRLHKRMLRASRAVDQLDRAVRARPADKADLLKESLDRGTYSLFRGQAAAPLGPDTWGGVHDGRLRHEAWSHLARAEAMVMRVLSGRDRLRFDQSDFDCDGHEEVLVTTPYFGAVVDPDAGGALVELDSWALPGNLLNTLARREEPWYAELLAARPLPALADALPAPRALDTPPRRDDDVVLDDPEDDDGERTPVERALVGGPESATPTPGGRGPVPVEFRDAQLAVDRWPRYAFLDRFLGPQASLDNFRRGLFPEDGDFVAGAYELLKVEPVGDGMEVHLARDGMVSTPTRPHSVRVVKRYTFKRDRAAFDVSYKILNRYLEPVTTRFGVELNLNLDSGRGGKQYVWFDRKDLRDLFAVGERPGTTEVVWGDEERGYQLVIRLSPGCTAWHFPVETVRRAPDGYETAFQGLCLVLWWELPLWGEEQRLFDVGVTLRVGRPGAGTAQAAVKAGRPG